MTTMDAKRRLSFKAVLLPYIPEDRFPAVGARSNMDTFQQLLERHSRAANLTINIFLAASCGICYVFLIALYFSQGLGIASFERVIEGTVAPTTVITVFGVVLTGATSALLARAVEHDLWNRLFGSSSRDYTIGELERRAQWSVSPLARLLYTLTGQSWLLRISGFLLFGTALLNPVLLYGVEPRAMHGTSTQLGPLDQHPYTGFAPYFEIAQEQLNVMSLASLSSKHNSIGFNISAPVDELCPDGPCLALANTTALQADCDGFSQWYSQTKDDSAININTVAQSLISDQTTVGLKSVLDYNFTSGMSDSCNYNPATRRFVCPPGDFAIILGAWITISHEAYDKLSNSAFGIIGSLYPTDFPYTFHQVDCRIRHGTVMVKQDSHGAAELERSTFQQSPRLASADVEAGIDPSMWQFNHAQRSLRSSWNFYSRGTADMEGPQTPQGLLGGTTAMAAFLFNINDTSEQAPRLVNDSQRVAEMLEAHFDIATRMAFARAPKAAWNITSTPEINGWSYDPTVLLILTAPLLATVLVLCICWQVYSDDVVVGYNPIVIARRAGEITTHSAAVEDLPGTGDLEESTKSNGAYSSIDSLPSSFAEQDHERGSGAVTVRKP